METITAAAAAVRNLIGQPDASIANIDYWTARAQDQGAELILFPELNVSGYITADIAHEIAESVPGPSTDKIIQIAQKRQITIAFGTIEAFDEKYYCTHVIVNGSGVIGKQRKIHVPAQEAPFWDAGNAIEVFDIGKAKIGITICRDSFFDEMTRTLYFKGAEIVLMPFGYYNVPRSRYLNDTIHGKSIVKACWTNGFFALVCNGAEERAPNQWEPNGRKFPGWAGIFGPWGNTICFEESEGNGETLMVAELEPAALIDRRVHPNFLAEELRPELYRFS